MLMIAMEKDAIRQWCPSTHSGYTRKYACPFCHCTRIKKTTKRCGKCKAVVHCVTAIPGTYLDMPVGLLPHHLIPAEKGYLLSCPPSEGVGQMQHSHRF